MEAVAISTYQICLTGCIISLLAGEQHACAAICTLSASALDPCCMGTLLSILHLLALKFHLPQQAPELLELESAQRLARLHRHARWSRV